MADLRGNEIKDSYQNVVTRGTGNKLENGNGVEFADLDDKASLSAINNDPNFYEMGTSDIFEPTPETGEFDDYAVRRFTCLYTRFGEMVHVTVNHRSNEVTLGTASGVLIYSGLPFLVDDIQSDNIIVAMNLDPSKYTNPPVSAELLAGTNTFRLRKANGNLFTAEDLLATGSGSNQNHVRFSMTYRIS